MSEFRLKIVSPEGIYYDNDVEILNVRTTVGQMGVLANMIPFTGALEISEMNILEKGQRKHFFISGGFIHVTKKEVTILTDAVEDPEHIDLQRAERAKARAEKRLASKDASLDIMRAQLALKRALTRINVKSYN